MALIPTLSEQILEETDVENLTHELQSHSKSRAAIIRSSSSSPSPAQSKPPSDRESDAGGRGVVARDRVQGAQLSDSITTASSQMSYAGSAVPSTHSVVPSSYSASWSASRITRSKAELWKEVKMLTGNPNMQP
ncbi:hypothetical protein BV22DRAFT_1135612 [Leucogyrophana mollusca]|uniref:Uncharacterized protein n=1 Tax=Leucogyrophana mollusca TaxID=85980 RepID=A0ACB8AUL8_9AGAM|nr:hypothetical protein BV22DRAFT_1135612 [Leucogyrophana mollusca]